MNESSETPRDYLKYPDIESELGEFQRVATTFGIDSSGLLFLARAGELVSLDPSIWEKLENTDSNSFSKGDWDSVHDHSNPDGEKKRDWEEVRNNFDSGGTLDAPIIMKYGDQFHLVSGNTRLMVLKASGIVPKVLLFEVNKQDESI